jgi:hypothetical protein
MQDQDQPPRYTAFPLPLRKYIPGKGIHPDKHPDGSHIPRLPPQDVKFGQDNWRKSQRYLYAIDLFNQGYWWEAHEVLEKLWIQTGRTTPIARFIQGIIQTSAALLKATRGVSPRGTTRLVMEGLGKLRTQTGTYLGIDVEKFTQEAEGYFAGQDAGLPKIYLQGLQENG